MGRPLLAKSKLLQLREAQRRQNYRQQGLALGGRNQDWEYKCEAREPELAWWVPHPRTGIYYPKGHERVMEDIPEGAARLEQTHWLRSLEGVENPQHYSSA